MSESLKVLKERVARYTKPDGYSHLDELNHEAALWADKTALANFAARILTGLPELKDLPPGPWKQTREFDVHDANDKIMVVTSGALWESQAEAIASLLIWARGVVGEIEG